VTTIAGARRFQLSVHGEARHAGGTPYPRRRDALVGASRCIVAIDRTARETDCLATVGKIRVHPDAVNVVPGRADFSLDLRAATDTERDAMWTTLHEQMQEICGSHNLTLEVAETHRAPSAPCAGWLQQAVIEGITSTGDPDPMGLWSPAGHDAMAMAGITGIGMLFVRCFDGISHHPGEAVREIDVARGLDALEAAVLEVARQVTGATPGQEQTP
jgi:allantoate deiminase